MKHGYNAIEKYLVRSNLKLPQLLHHSAFIPNTAAVHKPLADSGIYLVFKQSVGANIAHTVFHRTFEKKQRLRNLD